MAAHKRTLPRQSAPKAAKPGRAPASPAPPPEYDFPAAGPHARPELMDPERTPGTGALSEPGRSRDGDATG
ncbi:hypothetical protein [Xanthobacter oligotrophicus]|uniref:hypothetical protein n=1 Tax=Xanthobacter oligotrophicus TaxID=2607286 RepID=UPI0011F39C0C|nr:hypothetical protein [Xanthobacter oligotrophicus]MCG5235621.1 hypothetical protein [Xanthobacter oligotrophicus]